MVKFFKNNEEKKIRRLESFEENCWIDLVNPTDDEIEDAALISGIPEETLKAALDERFAYMFELKAALENAQGIMSAKWEEYYAMHEKYNRELKKIVSAWVTEQNYSEK